MSQSDLIQIQVASGITMSLLKGGGGANNKGLISILNHKTRSRGIWSGRKRV